MGPHERWTALLDILGRDGRLDVADASAELAVSQATIRRDLDHLSTQQLLTRTRGGAAPASVAYDLPLLAWALGTQPAEQPAGHDARGVDDEIVYTVVTNALNIANDLAVRRTIKLVVTGGVARPSSYELIGPLAEPGLVRMHLDVAVLGVDGFDLVVGVTADHEGEAAVTAQMVARSSTVVVVADSSKLGRRSFARVCTADAVHVLVTDSDAEPTMLDALREAGIEVVLA